MNADACAWHALAFKMLGLFVLSHTMLLPIKNCAQDEATEAHLGSVAAAPLHAAALQGSS